MQCSEFMGYISFQPCAQSIDKRVELAENSLPPQSGDLRVREGECGLSSLLWRHIQGFRVQAIHPGPCTTTINTQKDRTNKTPRSHTRKQLQINTTTTTKTTTHTNIFAHLRQTTHDSGAHVCETQTSEVRRFTTETLSIFNHLSSDKWLTTD